MTTLFYDAYCLVSVWNGVLFIRQGLYQEGVFKFKLVIPENYPDGDCPVSLRSECFVESIMVI